MVPLPTPPLKSTVPVIMKAENVESGLSKAFTVRVDVMVPAEPTIQTKSTGDRMVSWKLIALLKTEKYGTFEQFVKNDHGYVRVEPSMAYFWRQLRDTKTVDSLYLLISAVAGFLIRYAWDKFGHKAPKPVPAPSPKQDA